MQFKLEATIPTQQYGNIRPTVECDSVGDMHIAQTLVESLWDRYGEQPLKVKNGTFAEVKTFTGETVLYDDKNHIYKDLEGNVLTSASSFKKQFEKPFDTALLSNKIGTKYGVPADVIKSMWNANSRISMTFGNAIHYTMEQYWRFKDVDCVDKNYHLPKHPILRAVSDTFPIRDGEVLPEVMVSSVKDKMVGQIDAIHVIGDKVCELWDYKSDAEIDESKLKTHFIQLAFYADILKKFGWTVDNVIVWNYTADGWVPYSQKPQDLKELLANKK
jgi:hypothetical protein